LKVYNDKHRLYMQGTAYPLLLVLIKGGSRVRLNRYSFKLDKNDRNALLAVSSNIQMINRMVANL
jgi:hypothetical protein